MTAPLSMPGAVGAVRILSSRTGRRAYQERLRRRQSLIGAVGAVAQWNFGRCPEGLTTALFPIVGAVLFLRGV